MESSKRDSYFLHILCLSAIAYSGGMAIRPCPICRKPTEWEGNASKPFCSERCRIQDLGAWSSESYGLPAKPEEDGEGWGEGEDSEGS